MEEEVGYAGRKPRREHIKPDVVIAIGYRRSGRCIRALITLNTRETGPGAGADAV
ncbi:hypothetical protein [Acinetobacter baumannii]|uniref:hypothetical protein n=1 Tax=Acinetobacter baumannii TaxID=470 RepID=UPI003D2FBC1E